MDVRQIYHQHQIDIEIGGMCSFDVQVTNSRHSHNYYEVCLVLAGSGQFTHGSEVYALGSGDLFLAEPGVVHEISSYETRDLLVYFLSFSISELAGPGSSFEDELLKSFLCGHRIHQSGIERLASFLPLLADADTQSGVGRLTARQNVLLLALQMIEALVEVRPAESERALPPDMVRCLQFIDRNIDRRLSVDDLARHLGVSERTLRRRFALHFQTGIADEINHRRMLKAAHRLLMGFSAREVADEVGISDQAQFTRSFRRAFGVNPKRFQSSYMPGRLAVQTRPDVSAHVA